MPGPQTQLVAWYEHGCEKRQPADMIEMGVREKEIRVQRRLKMVAEHPRAGAAVEQQQARTASNLDARRVAAITEGIAAGAGDGTAHPPEPDPEIVLLGHGFLNHAAAFVDTRPLPLRCSVQQQDDKEKVNF